MTGLQHATSARLLSKKICRKSALKHQVIPRHGLQSLGLSVVAEGVETEAQRELLERFGCESYQGHLFCPALPIEALETFMHQQNVALASARNG